LAARLLTAYRREVGELDSDMEGAARAIRRALTVAGALYARHGRAAQMYREVQLLALAFPGAVNGTRLGPPPLPPNATAEVFRHAHHTIRRLRPFVVARIASATPEQVRAAELA